MIYPRRPSWGALLCAGLLLTCLGAADDPINVPRGSRGELPRGDDNQPLNLDFETGTLQDWTPVGEAFVGQPIRGEIDQNRPFGDGKRADKTGDFWIGGYEKLRDTPTGTLTSKSFRVTQPFASFLVGGGSHAQTRVELVREDSGQPFFKVSGQDEENMRPVVVDLTPHVGQKIFIRIVDEHTGGWGHVNFDDFRLHEARPRFPQGERIARDVPTLELLYPHAGLAPEEAARAMQVPPGFVVQVAAAEPAVQQPIAMAFDERGRIWVAEAYEYPRRAPEGQGRDRILIFEDTNLDGKLDKRTVFAEGLNLVSGLAVGFGGVWVGAAPQLLFLPDRDGDDRLDAEPQVLLDGWGYQDTHETLNAFIWGPDGWLYGCHGVFTHSKVGKPGTPDKDRVPLNAGIWRYHPVRHQFEVFSEGTSNPWGVDFNDQGQAFCTACVIPHLFHLVQGARYQRQAGQHFNPYTYDDIKTIADHFHYTGNQWNNNDRRSSDELGGGHAHAGAMIYLGGAWPEEFHNQILMHNIHGNRVNVDRLAPEGSGYVGSHGEDFLRTKDQWSQMLNLYYGPDGQVWMIDWYDRNQCHHNEREAHDRSNGRIFRVAYKNAPPVSVDLRKHSDPELIQLLSHPNEWYVRMARRLLQERAARGTLADGTRAAALKLALEAPADTRRLRALWTYHAIGGQLREAQVREATTRLLRDPSPYVRGWTIQLLCESREPLPPDMLNAFVALARQDPSPVVRLYLASAVQRLPVAQRWDILQGLVLHGGDEQDHNLPLMYWYALEPLCDADAQRAVKLALDAAKSLPLLRDFTIRKLGASPAGNLEFLLEGLGQADDDGLRLSFLRGINEALRGRRQITPPASANYVAALFASRNAEVQVQSLILAQTFGDPQAQRRLLDFLNREEHSVALRRLALGALVRHRQEELPAVLHALVGHRELSGDAIRALASFEAPETPAVLLAKYDSLPPADRRDVIITLCSRVRYAGALLDAIEAKRIPADQLSADLVRQLRNLKDEALARRIEAVWGIVRDSPEDKLREITRIRRTVNATSPPADPMLGRALFAKTCQQCHALFATGGRIGPDLTGSNRMNLDYLLSNIVDPSAVMAKEYQPSIVITNDGRTVIGLVRASDANAVTIQAANELLVIPREEIEELKLSEKSMMPDNLLQPLKDFQIRSLVAYLQSAGQMPILANEENAAGLFNGQDLTGWRGNEKLWRVENGEIVGQSPGIGHNEFLISELAVADFDLSLEVKLTPNKENSGIQFRSEPLPDGGVRGYQADVGAGWWGKLYEEHGRALLWKDSGEKHVQAEDWNQYRIRAEGSRIQTWINGQPCVDLDDPPGARRGILALQIHSGGPLEVRFRNLKLKPL